MELIAKLVLAMQQLKALLLESDELICDNSKAYQKIDLGKIEAIFYFSNIIIEGEYKKHS